ncbi:MAG: hypothetical protein WCR42_05300 [bacterium]
MNFIYKLSCFLIVSFLIVGCTSTKVFRPKKIYIEGAFNHKTKVVFPESFDNFKRTDVYGFNPECTDIGVSYKDIVNKNNIVVSIYIYPAGWAEEYRLRDEYFKCLLGISYSLNTPIDVSHKTIKVAKDGYKVLGLRATIKEYKFTTSVVLFECAKYFVKYRITADNIDSNELNKITTQLIDKFSPIDVVKFDPLKIGIDLHVCPAAVKDSFGFIPITTAAMTKIKWIRENVDSLERVSGFPGLYFECHRESLTQMIAAWDSVKQNKSQFKPYLNELLNIRNCGFLNEFICDQYMNTLLLPAGLKLRMEEYYKWKKLNKPKISLGGEIVNYYIGYEE